jgi:hypothetical protein
VILLLHIVPICPDSHQIRLPKHPYTPILLLNILPYYHDKKSSIIFFVPLDLAILLCSHSSSIRHCKSPLVESLPAEFIQTADSRLRSRFPQEQYLFWFREPYAIVVLVTCEVLPLLQNTSIVSAGKVSLVSTHQADTIYTIQKMRPIPFIPFIRYLWYLKIADTNKCHVWSISKAILVSAGLGRPTPLSYVQIENNI